MKSSDPIGVFDSGIGGLTVLKEINRWLPAESVTYLGDNRRAPYGELPATRIVEYTIQGLDYLYQQGVKALVIACNTATAAALDMAIERYDVPVLGVIQPTVQAVAASGGQRVGVLATSATVLSGEYGRRICAECPRIEVAEQACPLLVKLVEMGNTAGPVAEAVLERYLRPLIDWGADTLVLGCTHYPFLRGIMESLAGPDVKLVESGPPVVGELESLMSQDLIGRSQGPGRRTLATTGDPALFARLASGLWPDERLSVEEVDIEVSDEQFHLQAAGEQPAEQLPAVRGAGRGPGEDPGFAPWSAGLGVRVQRWDN